MTLPTHRLAVLTLLVVAATGCATSSNTNISPESVLTGTAWNLVAFGESAAAVVEGQAPTASFFLDEGVTRIGGTTGCNQYTAAYSSSDDSLTIMPPISTRMACQRPVMDQEHRFLTALEAVNGWNRHDSMLELTGVDGIVLLRFEENDAVDGDEIGRVDWEGAVAGYYVFTCTGEDEFAFTIYPYQERMEVWLPPRFDDRFVTLEQVRSASGARYEGDRVLVWNKGNDALLEVDGESFQNCVTEGRRGVWADASRRGVEFRAVGQEPGWHLELNAEQQFLFVYDYGEREVTAPAPEPDIDSITGESTYRMETDGRALSVVILEDRCYDIMSGEAFDFKTTVQLDERTFPGCGRALFQ